MVLRGSSLLLALLLSIYFVGCDDETDGDADADADADADGGGDADGDIEEVPPFESPAECAGEPSLDSFSFVSDDIQSWLSGMVLAGCFTMTATEEMGECTVAGGDASYWSDHPDGLYIMLGYVSESSHYRALDSVVLNGGTAVEALPVPWDMPGGDGPAGEFPFMRAVARCGSGPWATSANCECEECYGGGGPSTYHVQVYYLRPLTEEQSCARDQADGAACSFHFNCENRCVGGTCGGTSSGGECGDGSCDAGEDIASCPIDCHGAGDGCTECLGTCGGIPSCCTGCGCTCRHACGGCF